MRVATWNVNSIRTRVDRVVDWLVRADVDVLAMQETKCADDQFPAMPFVAAGYEVAHYGYDQWNGVAIASRVGLEDVAVGFEGQPAWGKDQSIPKTEARALGAFDLVPVVVLIGLDCGRHAVEAQRRAVAARERHVCNGAGDATIAVFERVNGEKPEMCDGGAQDGIEPRLKYGAADSSAALLEPVEEARHLRRDARSGRSLEVHAHAVASLRFGNDLHRSVAVGAPLADLDAAHAAEPGREQRRVPAEDPLARERRVEALRRVEKHRHDRV